MVAGWRRAFCTSIHRDRESKILIEQKQQQCNNNSSSSSTNQSPKTSHKFGFFSNPSTLKYQSQQPPISTVSGLRCRTSLATTCSVLNSPKLQCSSSNPKTLKSFQISNPSSPKSPSSFSLLKATLRFSKSRCGTCMHSVKSGQGTAIFTAECSHTFHFPCIVKKHPIHVCPVCGTTWKELPVLGINNEEKQVKKKEENREMMRNFKVYNDDEPLMYPSSLSRFNPIPESKNEAEEEDDYERDNTEFQGFNFNPVSLVTRRNIEVCLLPEAAIVAANGNYETYGCSNPSSFFPPTIYYVV